MTSFLIKIVVCPLVVALMASILPNASYAFYYQVITVGIVLALFGTIMEYAFLEKGKLWFNNILDFIASTLIVYFVSLLFATSRVTFFAALIIGFTLAITEHFTHKFLIESGRAAKHPAYK